MPYDRIEIGKMEFRGEAPDPNVWRIKYPVRGAEPFEFDFHGDHYTAQAPGLNDEDTPLWYVTGERKGRENKSKTEREQAGTCSTKTIKVKPIWHALQLMTN